MSETIVQPFPKSTANRKLCVQIFNAWNHIQQAQLWCISSTEAMDGRQEVVHKTFPWHLSIYAKQQATFAHSQTHKHTYQQLNMFIIFFRAAAEYYILDTFCWLFPMANYMCSVQWARTFFSSFFFGRLFYWVILCVWMFYFACSGAICLQVLVWDYLLSALKHNRCERTNERI